MRRTQQHNYKLVLKSKAYKDDFSSYNSTFFLIVENGSSTVCNYMTSSEVTEQHCPHPESKHPNTARVKRHTDSVWMRHLSGWLSFTYGHMDVVRWDAWTTALQVWQVFFFKISWFRSKTPWWKPFLTISDQKSPQRWARLGGLEVVQGTIR